MHLFLAGTVSTLITLASAPATHDSPRQTIETKRQVETKHTTPGTRRTAPDAVDRLAANLEPTRTRVYKRTGDRALSLHIFDPARSEPEDRRPAFVIFHGGGWGGGVPRRMYPFAAHYARAGLVGISVEYRLANARAGITPFDCVRDARSALRHVRTHAAELGVDPAQIIASGGSAGGHLAAGTALFDGIDEPGENTRVSCAPDALVLLFPVIDTSPDGYGNAKCGPHWRDISPLHRVRPGLPPTITFHGTGDTVTPFRGAQAFHDAMLHAGNRSELVVHKDGAHGYLMRDQALYDATLARADRFLATLGLWPGAPAPARPAPQGSARESSACDVLVYGATPGGIAAALGAARLGRAVALVAREDHVGGIVSNGLTNADIGRRAAVGGSFLEFTRRVLKHYQKLDARDPAAPNVKLCRDGYHCEAGVAERIFGEMIAGEGERIRLRLGQSLRGVEVDQGRLRAARFDGGTGPDGLVRWTARVFIDATYEGDLAAMAKAPYRVGREARAEHGEPHAGRIYARFGQTDPLPGSTGEADDAIQAFCFRFHVTDNPARRVAIPRPARFDRSDYRFVLDDLRSGRATAFNDIIQVMSMPNGKFELNSNHPSPTRAVPAESLDLAEENWDWPEADPDRRRELYARYLAHNVGLLWLLQNDPDVPAKVRAEAQRFGWARDEWPSNGHVPRQVYVRQGRRILGETIFTERDGELDPALGRTAVRPDAIAIVEYPFDSHACHKYDPAHPGVREGYIYIRHDPIQVPYRVIVPRAIDALLVPVACSCSHVGYNALRMEPVFMALGDAAGAAAHLAVAGDCPVRKIPVARLQDLLVRRGAVIAYLGDLPFDHPAFAAFQWLGARGFNPGYKATPDAAVTRRDARTRLERVLRFESKHPTAPAAGDHDEADGDLRAADLERWLRSAGYAPDAEKFRRADARALTMAEFASLVYSTLAPR